MPPNARRTPTRRTASTAALEVQSAIEQVADQDGIGVTLPVLGDVQLPPPSHLAWYAGIAALAALELVEWPVALIVGVGKALADNRHSCALQQLGEALEQAG